MASARNGTNARLRDLIAEAGWTYEALARAVCRVAADNGDVTVRANRSSVSHWLNGTVPIPFTRAYLAEAMSRRLMRPMTQSDLGFPTGGDEETLGLVLNPSPAETVYELATADLDRRSFLNTAAYSVMALAGPLESSLEAIERGQVAQLSNSTHHVGSADVDAVRLITGTFNDVDERLGGEHGRSAVVTYLAQDVTALCQGTFDREETRQALFSSAAQIAWLAGWKAHDAGKESLAQRYYLQAFSLAQNGEGEAHAAWLLRSLAHHAMDIGRPDRSVDLAQAAWDRGHAKVDSSTAALLALTLARAHAFSGDRKGALRWLGHAETTIGKASGAEEVMWWSSAHGPAENIVASHSAKTFSALGEHAKAEPITALTAARWNARTHPRVRALTLARLGNGQAAQGHIEQACASWSQAITPLQATRSARTREAVAGMKRTLSTPRYRKSSSARELLAFIAG